jgi:hypothetical protein
MGIALVRKEIHRVRQPENRGRKQEAGEHCQPGHKPDFLLIRKQPRFSPMSVMVKHSASFLAFNMPQNGTFSRGIYPTCILCIQPALRAFARGSSFIHTQSGIRRDDARPLEIAATFRQNDRKRYRIDFAHSVHFV